MLWAMQSIAHGADFVSFFRWRTATVGTEIYWHGILDYDNRDNRKLAEVGQVWQRVQKLQTLGGSKYVAAVGMLRDYDNLWDADADVWHRRLIKASEKDIFAAAQLSHTPLDMVDLRDETEAVELEQYKVLFYPHPLILTEARAKVLTEYVEHGGTLVIGARTGQKNIHGHCVMAPMPGLLSELTGTDVREFTFIGPADEPARMTWGEQQLGAGIFNDVLETCAGDVETLAVYASNYYAGSPALTERKVGRGRVLHFGGTFERGTVDKLLDYLAVREPWADVIRLPQDCEIAVREKAGVKHLIVLHYGWTETEIELCQTVTDVDDGQSVRGCVQLKPFETKVYRLS